MGEYFFFFLLSRGGLVEVGCAGGQESGGGGRMNLQKGEKGSLLDAKTAVFLLP